jgi:hypothetical protein
VESETLASDGDLSCLFFNMPPIAAVGTATTDVVIAVVVIASV